MLLNILGLPKDVKYSEIKDIIKNDCKIESFLLDNMVLDDDKCHKKIRIGVADESEGEILMQRLNGCRISGQLITVVPIGKTTQPQMKPHSDYGNAPHVATQGQYMGQLGAPHWQATSQWSGPNETPYRGIQSLDQSFPGQFESSAEGYGSKFPVNPAPIQNVNTFGGYPSKTQAAYPNVISKDHFLGPSQYNEFSSDKNYRDQSSYSTQSWKQVSKGIERMESRDPTIRRHNEPMNRIVDPIARRDGPIRRPDESTIRQDEPIRTREVNLGRGVEPMTNRHIHESLGGRNDTMGLLNIQSRRDVTMGRRDAPPMGLLETSMRRSDIPIGRSEPMKHHNNEGLIRDFSRQYERTEVTFPPKHNEVIDCPRGFRIDGPFPKHSMAKVDENRAARNDFRGKDVRREERRWDIEREGKGDNIQGNIRREVSFPRMSPDRQSFNRRPTPMKRDSSGRFSPRRYDQGQMATPIMKQVRPAYEPISTPQESNQAIYSVGYQPRLAQNVEYPTPGLRFEARDLQERNKSYPIKNLQVAEIRSRISRSPLRHASPDTRDRYQRSHSPRSPRRSWNLEKRRSPQANQEIPTPAWSDRRQDYPQPDERPWEKPAPSRDQPRFEPIRNEHQNPLHSWKDNLQGQGPLSKPVHANPRAQAPAPRFDRRNDYHERPPFKEGPRHYKKDAHIPKPFGHPSEPRGFKREFPDRRERSPPRKEPRFAQGYPRQPPPSRKIDNWKPSEPKILDPQRNRAVNTISLEICARNNVENSQVHDELKVFLHTRMNNTFGNSEVPYNDLLAWFCEKYSSQDEDIMISDIIAVLKQKEDTSKGSRVSSKREEAKPMTQKDLIKEKYKQTIDEIRKRILIRKNMRPNNEDFKYICEELSLTLLRILLKFGEKFGPLCDINSKYKTTYTEKDEDEIYEEVLKAIQKKRKRPATEQPDSVPSKIAKTAASDLSCEGEDGSKSVLKNPDAVKNAPSGTDLKQAKPKAKGAKKPKQPPPLPKKPQKLYKPNKEIIDVDMSKFTKRNEDGSVELNDVMSLALDQELQKIKELVSGCIPDPKTATPEEKAVLEAGILDGITNALGLNITKNLLNIHNQLNIKIFSKRPLPGDFKSVLYSKLRIKGIVKKSINLEYYKGFVDSYEDFYLATLQGVHVIGPMKVHLAPIYNFVIVPPKVKTKFTRASIGCKDSKPKAKTGVSTKNTEVATPAVSIKNEADEVTTELKKSKMDTANDNKTDTDINPAKIAASDETKNGNETEVNIAEPVTISNESTNINETNKIDVTQTNKDDVTKNEETKTSQIVSNNDDVCKDTQSITKNDKGAILEVNKGENNVAINDIDDQISTDTNEKHNSESDSTSILNSGIVLDECVGSDCDDQ